MRERLSLQRTAALRRSDLDEDEAPLASARGIRRPVGTLGRLRKHPSAIVGSVILLIIVVAALSAPALPLADPLQINPREARQGFSREHLLGADQFGRDILSRVVYGGRVSLLLGVVAVAIGGVVGSLGGIVAGYCGGKVDLLIMQCNDVLLAFPAFLLALGIVAIMNPGIFNVMIAVGIALVPQFARIARGSTLPVRELEFVTAARVAGAPGRRIVFRHVLPNVVAPIIVFLTVSVGGAILTGASLSFIGVGAQPPKPEWGLMVNEGRSMLRLAWWISTIPGFVIMIVVIAINLLGDALRDVWDPKLRR